MSSLPAYLKTWNFTGINQRITFVSLNDTMATFLYGIKNYAVGTLGAAVWGSSDGTTGDNTDRWASKANATTRGATTGAANSWVVFAWGTGQLCLSYVGATDDIARISFSPGSLFALAGTHTFTPTATDECIIATALSLINATTSADRVFHVVGDTARTVLRIAIFRQSTLAIAICFERMIEGPGFPSGLMVGVNSTLAASLSLNAGSHISAMTAATTGTGNEMKFYLNSAVRAAFGGSLQFNGAAAPFNANPPAGNAGAPVSPVCVGCSTAGNDGMAGTRYDIVTPLQTSLAVGQTFDDIPQGLRMMALFGSVLIPWDPAQGATIA